MTKINLGKNLNSEKKLKKEADKFLLFCSENTTEEAMVLESGDVVYKAKSVSELEWEFVKERDWAEDFFKIESGVDRKNKSHKKIVKAFDSDMKALLNFLDTYSPFIERFRKSSKDKSVDPDIEASLENCLLVLQKLGEWQKMLENTTIDKIEKNQVKDIQEKLEEVWNVINREHGHTKVSDDMVNNRYYTNSYIINEIRRYYKLWRVSNPKQKPRNFLIKKENEPVNKRIRVLLSSLDPSFNKDPEDLKLLNDNDIVHLERILSYALTEELSDAALYFTTFDSEENISGDPIHKKTK